MRRELTGRHVLIIALCAFGTIIAANLAMLFAATGSFPGLVVKNSYVAGVGWNERTAAQEALGWEVSVEYAGNALALAVRDEKGAPVTLSNAALTIGRPTTDVDDRALTLAEGQAAHRIPMTLGPGAWRVDLRVADPAFEQTISLFVPEGR